MINAHTKTLSMLSDFSIRYPEMYSPPAAAPNHQTMTPVKATPMLIHTADSIAASFVEISCASRWTTSRSTSSMREDQTEQDRPLPRMDLDVDEVRLAVSDAGKPRRDEQAGCAQRLAAARTDCAAARRAIGTRNGEHDT